VNESSLYAVSFRRGSTYYVLADGYDHAVLCATEKLNASGSRIYAESVKSVRLIAKGYYCANMYIAQRR
jgi:hypothetical protein